jgi:hypothetical protein
MARRHSIGRRTFDVAAHDPGGFFGCLGCFGRGLAFVLTVAVVIYMIFFGH